MKLFTTAMLKSLLAENKRQAEGLMPEIIKRLISHSASDISRLRMPNGDDIWAPGYDGIVQSDSATNYVPEGISVWEIGTTSDTLKKINDDYNKRTANPSGINPLTSVLILVVPRVWAYKKSITTWEGEHTDWKEVRVYDASVVCDWINSDIITYTWLMETLTDCSLHLHSLTQAWDRFSNKTNPKFSYSLFLNGREEQEDKLLQLVHKQNTILVKGESTIDASGFILSTLLSDPKVQERVIVADDKQTYEAIYNQYSKIIIFADFEYSGDYLSGDNTTIIRFNKETTIKADIVIDGLSKRQVTAALIDMGLNNGESIYLDTRGNLRALIRKIPGTTIDATPDWCRIQDCNLLLPLVFMQHYDRDRDRTIIEKLGGIAYSIIENKYSELLRLEDSPIKPILNNYCIINYEEAWNVLNPSVFDQSFERLTGVVLELLQTRIPGSADYGGMNYRPYNTILRNLLINYITYSYDSNAVAKLQKVAKQVLEYITIPQTQDFVLSNLSILAEATPRVVMDFLLADYHAEYSIIKSLFYDNTFSTKYTEILYALEKLALFPESAIDAVNMLFELYCMRDTYPISNSPKMSLMNLMNFINRDGTLLLQQKVTIIKAFIMRNEQKGCRFVSELLKEKTIFKSVRHGEKSISTDEVITYKDYFAAIREIAEPAFEYAITNGDHEILSGLLMQYKLFDPQYLRALAEQFDLTIFDQIRTVTVNYELRDIAFNIQKYKHEDLYPYLDAIRKWIEVTTSKESIIGIAWMFLNSYSLPAEELLIEDEYDFTRITTRKEEIRLNALSIIQEENFENNIELLVTILKDETGWGILLSKIAVVESMRDTIYKSLSLHRKLNILAGFLDYVSLDYFERKILTEDKEIVAYVLQRINRKDCVDSFSDESYRFAYWAFKWMMEFDERTYGQLLQYNPRGLVFYYYRAIKTAPRQYLDNIKEVFSAILVDGNPYVQQSVNSTFEHEIEEIIKIVDKEFYSDDWALLCWNLYQRRYVSTCSESMKKYLFYHPTELITLSNKENELYWEMKLTFTLPSCAFDNYQDIRFFIQTLMDYGKGSFGGMLLGKTITNESGRDPHEFICNLMEEFNNADFDNSIFVGYYNNRGMRTVDDGSVQMKISMYFRNRANQLAIQYPHASALLRAIAESYEQEAKQDYVYSEISEL